MAINELAWGRSGIVIGGEGGGAYVPTDAIAIAFIAQHNSDTGFSMGSRQKETIDTTAKMLRGEGTSNGTDFITASVFPDLWLYAPTNNGTATSAGYSIGLLLNNDITFSGFTSGDFDVTGLTGGSGKYGDTGLAPSDFGTQDSIGMFWYSRDNNVEASTAIGCVDAGNGFYAQSRQDLGETLSRINHGANITTATATNSSGLWQFQRSTSTNGQIYRNGAVYFDGAMGTSVARNTLDISVHGRNVGGSVDSYSSREYSAFGLLNRALTANESLDLFEVIDYYQTNIITGGRNV